MQPSAIRVVVMYPPCAVTGRRGRAGRSWERRSLAGVAATRAQWTGGREHRPHRAGRFPPPSPRAAADLPTSGCRTARVAVRPGLRRDEVAALAAMSTDYYTRLEQGRGPHPSPAAAAVAGPRAATDLRRARSPVPPGRAGAAAARAREQPRPPGCCTCSTGSPTRPRSWCPTSARRWSRTRWPVRCGRARRRELHRVAGSLVPAARQRFPREDWAAHSRTHAADLRATYGRRRGDADVEDRRRAAARGSAEFAELWEQHEVAVRRADRKRIAHPEVGLRRRCCARWSPARSAARCSWCCTPSRARLHASSSTCCA